MNVTNQTLSTVNKGWFTCLIPVPRRLRQRDDAHPILGWGCTVRLCFT